MSLKIIQIPKIQNMAVFQDFNWNTTVKNKKNEVINFAKVNIIYGRNYSGKTTLSRILRAFETGELSSNYKMPIFELQWEDGSRTNQHDLHITDHCLIRTFNEDFISENLAFLRDENDTITPFAVLGANNQNLEEEIQILKNELGTSSNNTGLQGLLNKAIESKMTIEKTKKSAQKTFDKGLSDQARKIKEDVTIFGLTTYFSNHLEKDIENITSKKSGQLTEDQIQENQNLVQQRFRNQLSLIERPDFSLDTLCAKTKDVLEREITPRKLIDYLEKNDDLNKWARTGLKLHEDRETCAFCTHHLDRRVIDKLREHFNEESETLLSELKILKRAFSEKAEIIPENLSVELHWFDEKYHLVVKEHATTYKDLFQKFKENIQYVISQLDKRIQNVDCPINFSSPQVITEDASTFFKELDQFFTSVNQENEELESRKKEAQCALRLHEVANFIQIFEYEKKKTNIADLDEEWKKACEQEKELKQKMDAVVKQISALQNQMKDEGAAAEEVNKYLSKVLGQDILRLIPQNEGVDAAMVRFEVQRGEQKAFHLSEGEKSLIAFCYFLARLKDHETANQKPIIWIDDPISSLDGNHIFLIYSLIRSEIVTAGSYTQLFVSTHNLEFLKYLRRLKSNKSENNPEINFFVTECHNGKSLIKVMPLYLMRFVTEFNYLFSCIYKVAHITSEDDENYHLIYSFGNNARKFLELYLYYRFPNGNDSDSKYKLFFGDQIAAYLVERINNEQSHLLGTFERGERPIDLAEIKYAARLILKTIEDKDEPQYKAFEKSLELE